MKAIILDIEGTTTDINFVHKTLFPYARARMAEFVRENQDDPSIAPVIESIKQEHLQQDASLDDVIEQLHTWIDEDKKVSELKALQGYIWVDGYVKEEYKGHLYPEVVEMLSAWKSQGLKLYIYSSGSVKAQKLLFSHSTEGDITHFFEGYFDTGVGGKKEAQSYQNILNEIELDASEVLFLSDNEAELDAARACGVHTVHINRDGLYTESKHTIAAHFHEVHIG